jgi:biotin-independent malonate decarboxylase gamma subunit
MSATSTKTIESKLSTRGRSWFEALTGQPGKRNNKLDPTSLLVAEARLSNADAKAKFLCIVPDPAARFPRARDGEVGLEEAYALAAHVREVIDNHKSEDGERTPIIAIVDVKSQAYGRREETAAIHHAAAAAADAYASARMAGHPVVALVVGQALSGAFLTHGYQANRILALDDPGVIIHAMHKESAARVTRRTVKELDKLAETIVPLSYDIKDFAKLGILYALLQVTSAEHPQPADIALVKKAIAEAIKDARKSPKDLSCRWLSKEASVTRGATLKTREAMFAQWSLKDEDICQST